MQLRLRLALIVAAGLTVLLVGTGFAYVRQLHGSLTASIDTSLWNQRHALLVGLRQQAAGGGHRKATAEVLPSQAQLLTAGGTVAVRSTSDDDDAVHPPMLTVAQVLSARRGPLWLTRSFPGAEQPRLRLLAFPVPGQTPAVVAVVASPTALLDEAVNHVEEGFLFAGPVIVIGGAFAGWLLAGAALRPVERMRRQAAAATVDGSVPVLDVPRTRDEIAALAATMNELLGRLRAAVLRERSFVADAGHELRTPLAILRTELELASKPHRTRDELTTAVGSAAEETDRLARLTEALLLLAREGDDTFLRRERVDVRAVLAAGSAGFQRRAQVAGTEIRLCVEPAGLVATWDQNMIRQVVSNLVDNALRYGKAGGTVQVGAAGFAGRVVLRVTDDGPGFPAEFLPHAFERFSRADPARSSAHGGAGLGLSIVDVIATAHGGRATVRNLPGGGAEVRADLPEPAGWHM